jgi:hypothetical protein
MKGLQTRIFVASTSLYLQLSKVTDLEDSGTESPELLGKGTWLMLGFNQKTTWMGESIRTKMDCGLRYYDNHVVVPNSGAR